MIQEEIFVLLVENLISFYIKEWITKKSYERRDYESVDDNTFSWVMSQTNKNKKRFPVK